MLRRYVVKLTEQCWLRIRLCGQLIDGKRIVRTLAQYVEQTKVDAGLGRSKRQMLLAEGEN